MLKLVLALLRYGQRQIAPAAQNAYDDEAEIDLASLRLENGEIDYDDFDAIVAEHTLVFGEKKPNW